jgi:hypothetical protein
MNYSIFYRRAIGIDKIRVETEIYDLFVSSYNSSDRVSCVFSQIRATKKLWLIHPEYQYIGIDLPTDDEIVRPEKLDEINQIDALLERVGSLAGLNICIDITGFMRHVIAFLVAKLAFMGVSKVSILYSEPISYRKQEETIFSTTTTGRVRPVRGMGGTNDTNARDHLIIGVGYDHKLISEVSNFKDDAVVHPIFAFPSLSADMYQQSALKAAESGDVAQRAEWISNRKFAPANDPFSTASVLSELVSSIDRRGDPANIYLAPLSTKAQTLGFALYWHFEGQHRSGVSLLLPECQTYARETSSGLRRLWLYEVELDGLPPKCGS